MLMKKNQNSISRGENALENQIVILFFCKVNNVFCFHFHRAASIQNENGKRMETLIYSQSNICLALWVYSSVKFNSHWCTMYIIQTLCIFTEDLILRLLFMCLFVYRFTIELRID